MPSKASRRQAAQQNLGPHNIDNGNSTNHPQPTAPNNQLAVMGQPGPVSIQIPSPTRTPSPEVKAGEMKLDEDTARSVSPVKRQADYKTIMYDNSELEKTVSAIEQAVADLPDPVPPAARTPSPKAQAVSVPPADSAPTSKAANEKSEDQVRRIRVVKTEDEFHPLMYVDPETDRVDTLINLAMIGVMAEGTKMTKRDHCYAPKSPSMAASSWIPSSINSAYLPGFLTDGIHRAERSFSKDSKEDLGFLGHCITYVHKLYPDKSDKQMMFIWKHVREGIITLKRLYKTEPPRPLKQSMVERWESGGLKMGMSFDDMFDNWIDQVEGYYEERNESVEKKKIEESLPEPVAASVIALLEAANTAQVGGEIAANAIEELKKVVASLLNTGTIPRKLHPLSEKIKALWPKGVIHEKISEIERLGRERDLTVKNVKLLEMIEKIDKIANEYAETVKNEMIEVMSL